MAQEEADSRKEGISELGGSQLVRSASSIKSGREDGVSLPSWHKKEVVVHERTTHYTTVDENGVTQVLLESETQRTEVEHMECKDTGEFAHRELTTFEQKEVFNGEDVLENRGFEEYIHLKSLTDEIEVMDGSGQRARDPMPAPADEEEYHQRPSETSPHQAYDTSNSPHAPRDYNASPEGGSYSPRPNQQELYRNDFEPTVSPLSPRGEEFLQRFPSSSAHCSPRGRSNQPVSPQRKTNFFPGHMEPLATDLDDVEESCDDLD